MTSALSQRTRQIARRAETTLSGSYVALSTSALLISFRRSNVCTTAGMQQHLLIE
jgi:hypothetical protein